jgi:ATP-dependent 26S proteasome regulatory subunit
VWTLARTVEKVYLAHLEAELTRINILLDREVQRWKLAGQDVHDAFRGLYVSDDEADKLLQLPLGTSWGQSATLPQKQENLFKQALIQAENRIDRLLQKALDLNQNLPLVRLATIFELSRFEVDALLICLAPMLDLRYEKLYGYLQDDVTKKQPTLNLILNLLCDPGINRMERLPYFSEQAALLKYHLIEKCHNNGEKSASPLAQAMQVDATIFSWLLGKYLTPVHFGEHASVQIVEDSQQDLLLSNKSLSVLPLTFDPAPVIILFGQDTTSQDAMARVIAAKTGRPLLQVNLQAIADQQALPIQSLRLSLRDSRLLHAIPYISGWDVTITDGTVSPTILTEICQFPDIIIVGGKQHWQARGIDRERQLFWLQFDVPDYPQRLALWSHYTGISSEQEMMDQGLQALAGQFALSSGHIRDAVATAKDTAAQRDGQLERHDLFSAARAHSNPRLSTLARKIEPRYGWDDIILPADQLAQLREMIATVQARPMVLDTWGVGKKLVSSRGVTALFSGPPGTGKTMAAEIIARGLELDLYKIDLSTVVSKYIGETEKNIERIFIEAEQSNAILFFDEADALFGKRSEVKDSHDRYANIEISYLLQRMEAYDGVTVLATNLRANLDEAFTRRLQFAVNFPFPEAEDRKRIWKTLIPNDVPVDKDIDFDYLAERFRFSGGNIRNVIVSATYLAAADGGLVTMGHFLHGTRRELQKMGRLVSDEDLKPE